MSRTRRSRPAVVAIALFAFTGLVAGCGTSSSSEGGDTTTTVAAGKTTTSGAPTVETTTTEAGAPTTTTQTTAVGGDGGGETGDRQAYIDAIAASLSGDESLNPFTADQADCLGNGYVDTIGLDEITSAGVTPEEFGQGSGFGGKLDIDEKTANALYDTYSDCDIDLSKVFKDVAASISGKPLNPEEEACIDRTLTDDALRTSFVADLRGEDLQNDPLDALETCVDLGAQSPDAPSADTTPATIAPPSGN